MKISLRRVSLSRLGMLSMLLALYSTGTIAGFFSTWTITLLLLAISAAMFFLARSDKGKWSVSSIAATWFLLTVLCIIGVFRGSLLTDLSFYALCFLLLLLGGTISADAMLHSLNWIKRFGLFFAAGCYWQYLFPNMYYTTLYPLFDNKYQDSIRRQFTYHKMCTGFTFQTAVTVEYIILGLVLVLYQFSKNENMKGRIRSAFEIVFLLGGLLLTGKRSPVLIFPAAFIIVDLITVKRGKKVSRLLFIILFLILLLTIFSVVAPLFLDSRNSIARMLEISINSTEDLDEASNGRFALGSYAISEFLQHPVFGIGWGKYNLLYNRSGAHNIYLQLLCDNGIVGFLIGVGALFYALSFSIRMLKRQLKKQDSVSALLMKYSVFTQIYILVYGLFGNPLYDSCYVLMYFLGLWIAVVVDLSEKAKGKYASYTIR